jgi:hypothetical protein
MEPARPKTGTLILSVGFRVRARYLGLLMLRPSRLALFTVSVAIWVSVTLL